MITFKLAWPTPDLSPNGRVHWSKRAKALAIARRSACYMTKAACGTYWVSLFGVPAFAKVAVHMAFTPPTKRKRDLDNLIASTKAYRDGIADALGIDDSRFVISNEIIDGLVKLGEVRVTISSQAATRG